jgi:hypothetical protein
MIECKDGGCLNPAHIVRAYEIGDQTRAVCTDGEVRIVWRSIEALGAELMPTVPANPGFEFLLSYEHNNGDFGPVQRHPIIAWRMGIEPSPITFDGDQSVNLTDADFGDGRT